MLTDNRHNDTFYWCTCFVRELYRQGVRRVVISPGSRSTPLTLAFAAHPGFEKTVILDERSAAFTALGHAKATGTPSVLVCTSGTALANYSPAVFEAANSGTPLIIASADRPPHRRGIGSPQTIDQIKIFANASVFFHEAGEPSAEPAKLKRLEMAAAQAVYAAKNHFGTAHINFPFSKPLEPDPDFLAEIEQENSNLAKKTPLSTKYSQKAESVRLSDEFWEKLASAKRPVIAAGPFNAYEDNTHIAALAEFLDAPVLAEPGANLPAGDRLISGYAGFLRNKKNAALLEPDLIIRTGAFPINNALQHYLKTHQNVTQILLAHPALWQDGDVIPAEHIHLPAPLAVPEIQSARKTDWMAAWKEAEKRFAGFRSKLLQQTESLTDGGVFHTLYKFLPRDGFSMLSNSFPVRDFALFGENNRSRVFVNRGAAGIDGIISTALGISRASRQPGVLFIGDLAFLHDSNALLSHKTAGNSLIIVILNNRGGTIFNMLPVAQFTDKFDTYYRTEQDVSIPALCRAYGAEHSLVTRPEQLIRTFEQAAEAGGVQIIECLTEAPQSMKERRALWNFDLSGEQP